TFPPQGGKPLPRRRPGGMMTGPTPPPRVRPMTPTRRQFLATSATAATVAGLPNALSAQTPKADPKAPPFKLGMVTYNVAAQWDLPTILKVCKATGIAAVECRTTHKHGVEPTLTAEERDRVKRQFADSGV